ncbi:hypothetical protein RvY_14477-2 [Ramazzottius varieornatus]|uniref:Uncharacterized protein n=1 Tax=Ramazzottius varieornatus TaxID=947166 RepID=A0A1D1VTF2_RAMVA|nr:hypothetical protein RvY_14477-2 [Ramazzottius varieornatus]
MEFLPKRNKNDVTWVPCGHVHPHLVDTIANFNYHQGCPSDGCVNPPPLAPTPSPPPPPAVAPPSPPTDVDMDILFLDYLDWFYNGPCLA